MLSTRESSRSAAMKSVGSMKSAGAIEVVAIDENSTVRDIAVAIETNVVVMPIVSPVVPTPAKSAKEADSESVRLRAWRSILCDHVAISKYTWLEGRLAELEKVRRVIERSLPGAPHETLLVIEAATGMNAMAQARAFHDAMTLTGIVLTKLDGTSRGGTILAIEAELDIPVKLVGLGEGIDDLNVFDPAAYLDALFAGVLDVPTPRAAQDETGRAGTP